MSKRMTANEPCCKGHRCAAAHARKLASELIHRADTLMYEAKSQRSARVHSSAVRVEAGVLVEAVAQQAPEPGTT